MLILPGIGQVTPVIILSIDQVLFSLVIELLCQRFVTYFLRYLLSMLGVVQGAVLLQKVTELVTCSCHSSTVSPQQWMSSVVEESLLTSTLYMSEYPKPIAYNPFLAVMLNFLQNQTYTYIHLHIHTFIHIYIKVLF